MLHVKIPAQEYFDENTETFFETKEQTLVMEHSLISISKWEAKWKKSYFSDDTKTEEELLDYLRCMTITPQNLDDDVYRAIPADVMKKITDYIEDPMTATTITDTKNTSGRKQVVTSELVYYWMIAQNIPIEFEKWHINRLLTLIRVCAIKNDPNPKKMSRSAVAKQNRAINAARRAKYGTRG